MIINKTEIKLGEKKVVRLSVSKLPSGTEIDIFVHVFRSEKPGPTVLFLGGLHGDEINGVETVRKSINTGAFDSLTAGTVIAIPLLNVYGFINYSRDLPDGKDINRSFPGSSKGSLASRVAKTLTRHILPLVDMGVDFHTGGKSIHNVPQLRIDDTMEEALPLALKFGARLIIKSSLIPRSLRKECNRRKIPMLVFEGGESLRLDQESIAEGRAGILNLLFAYGMIENHEPVPFENVLIEDNHWIRASFSGVFESYKKPNDHVERGDLIGQISTPYDKTVKKVKARKKGVIFGINNNPVVNKGDALYHIGF